mgnify:CR=1 FL=1
MRRAVDVTVMIRDLSAGGGAEISALDLANMLADIGYRVDMLVVNQSGPVEQRLQASVGLHVLEARGRLSEVLKVRQYLRRRRPGLLIGNLTTGNVVALTAAMLSWSGTRVIAIERQAVPPLNWPMRRLIVFSVLVPLLYGRAFRVVCVSDALRENVERFARLRRQIKNTVTIYDPIDIKNIREKALAPCDHAWLNKKEVPVFIMLCRLEEAKGIDVALKAFMKVKVKCSARLVILGEGSHQARLARLAEQLGVADDVDFAGYRLDPYPFLGRSDVLVSASRIEGFGRTLVEAMALNVPVVATDCPVGPAEILEDGRWGELVPVDDPNTLSRAMLRALSEPIYGGGRAGDFDYGAIADAYEKLVKTALK